MTKRKIKPLSKLQKMTIQLYLGVILAIMGVALIWVGLFIPPCGIVHASVLTGVGEIFTFSGALIGIDYTYKYRVMKYITHDDEGEMADENDKS